MDCPIEPKEEDCCNSGCNPCIFDVYERQLRLFKINKASSDESQKNGISELKYTTFIVAGIKVLCDSQKIFKFKRNNQNNIKVWWKPGDHFLYKYISDTLSCTRAYTPIKLNSDDNDDFDFSIVLKSYDNGIVSKHLFKLSEGEKTLWRGPYGSYKIEPNVFNRIIMIAQGTGIAPFITIIENIVNNEDDMTKIVLCYCCRSMNEILFRDELYLYRSYWNFSYEIFLTHTTNSTKVMYEEPITTQRFSYEDLYKLEPYSNDQFLLCGSSDFMNIYKNVLREKLGIVKNVIQF